MTCRKCGKVGHLASAERSSGTPQLKAKGGGKKCKGGKGASAAKTYWNCREWALAIPVSQEEGPSVEELTTASQAGSQEATMVGVIGSYFDFGSVSEGDPRVQGRR